MYTAILAQKQHILHTSTSFVATAAAAVAATMEPPAAEAHVAIGIMPTFFAENPRQWFQTAEAQFATARPAPNNGQKYFHLLQKLPAEIMNNCSDIIATCTIAASSNSGDPYTAMKSAILDYTQKPKWSCYMDLHSLPPQGDIRPSLLMAKLSNTLPHGTPTNTDLFYSFFMFRMPQYLREVLAANEYATAHDMAVAADRVWDLRQSAPHRRRRRGLPTPRAVRVAAPARLQLRPRPLTEPALRPSPDPAHTGIPR